MPPLHPSLPPTVSGDAFSPEEAGLGPSQLCDGTDLPLVTRSKQKSSQILFNRPGLLTVGLPARRLGGVLPKGDMLLLELLVLLLHGISMCFGAVIFRPPDWGGLAVILSSSSSLM